MAGIDPSIPLAAQAPQTNPLETLGQVAGIAGAMNQNRLFQQQFQTNLGLGRIYKDAIDPATGTLDTNKLNDLIKNDPSVTIALPEAIQASQGAQLQQLGITKEKLDIALQHLGAMNDRVGSLLGRPQGQLSQKDVISQVGTMISEGLLKPDEAAAELQNMPQDEQGIRSWLTQYLLRGMDAQGRVNALIGTPQPVNTGQRTEFVQSSSLGGVRDTGAGFTNQISPEAAFGRVPTFQGNQPGSIPFGATVPPQFGGFAPPSPTAGTPGGIFAPASPTATPGPNAVPTNAPSSFIPTGPRLGQEAAATTAGQASAGQGIDLQRSADQVPAMKATLANLDDLLGKFTSGPNADWTKVAKSALNSTLPVNLFDAKAIASQEDFNKQAALLAQAQFHALGGTGTDSKLESAMSTSPNSALSTMGNKEIIALLKGNADALAAKNRAWQSYLQSGHGPDEYGTFSTEFNRVYDPRVFQFQYLDPKQRQDLVKSLKPADLKQFKRLYNFSAAQGWLGAQ